MLNNEMIHFQGLKARDRVAGAHGRGEVPSDAEVGGQGKKVAGCQCRLSWADTLPLRRGEVPSNWPFSYEGQVLLNGRPHRLEWE